MATDHHHNTLLILDRGYRGGVETQFADALYLARELNRQLGGLDLLLRGLAVSYGATAAPVPSLSVGKREITTLPDPRRSVQTLLAEGVHVWVEKADLAAVGRGTAERLLSGIRQAHEGELARRWPDYDRVWFL